MSTEAHEATFSPVEDLPKRRFASGKLRTKLIVAFLIATLIPLGLLSYLNDRVSRIALTNAANQALFAAASQTAAGLDDFLNANLDAVSAEAQLSAMADYLDLPAEQRSGSPEEAEVVAILRAVSRRDVVNISSYALLDRHGRNVADTFALDIGLDERGYDYFQVPFETGEPYASPVILGQLPGQAFIYFSSPVRTAAGETVGVLRVSYNASALQRLLAQSNGLAGPDSFGVLFDENHIHLAHGTAPETILKALVPLDPARVLELQAARRLPDHSAVALSTDLPDLHQKLANATEQPFFATEDVATGGKFDQVAVTTMKTQPWLVAFFQPQEVFLAPVEAQSRTVVLLAAAIAGVLVLAAIRVGQLLAGPITRLTAVAEQIIAGDLTAQARVESGDEIGTLAATFNSMTSQLRDLVTSLEQQVAERTQGLQAAAQVAQATTSVLDPDELLRQTVNLVRDRFDLYYVGLFLLDEDRRFAVLQAGTGKAGRQMLAQGHRLENGGDSMIGQCVSKSEARISLDVGEEAVRFDNPILPYTRSEMALPLRSRGQVIGAMTVQSTQAAAFNETDIAVMQAMADQVAVAIDNAHLFSQLNLRATQLQTAAEVSQAATSIISLERLLTQTVELIRDRFNLYYVGLFMVDKTNEWAILRSGTGEAGQIQLERGHRLKIGGESMIGWCVANAQARIALDVGEEAVRFDNPFLPDTRSELALPLISRNKTIGALSVQSTARAAFSHEDITTLQTMADQLANAIQNARFFEQTQKALAETESLYRASAELNTAQNYNEILDVLRRYTLLDQAQSVSVALYDRPWKNNRMPEWIHVMACWGQPSLEVGSRYPMATVPGSAQVMRPEAPTLVEDTASSDPHPDDSYRTVLLQSSSTINGGAKDSISVPLVVGGQCIGSILALYQEPTTFPEAVVRHLTVLSGQAAVVIQGLRQLQEIQAQARREVLIREITGKVRASTDLETILQTTVTEVSRALGISHGAIRLGTEESLKTSGSQKSSHRPVASSLGDATDAPGRQPQQQSISPRRVAGTHTHPSAGAGRPPLGKGDQE